MSISKNRFRLHASRLQVPTSTCSPSATNAFACSICGYPRICTPASISRLWWNYSAAPQAQLFGFAGTNRRTRAPRSAAATIRPIMPRSVTYGFTTSSVSCAPSISVAIAVVIGLNRPGALWSTTAEIGARAFVERWEELRDALRRDLAAEPAQARDEHELQLRHDRPFDANEQVVKRAVLEVILDSRTADPADPAVDDDDLAMVDMPQPAQVPAGLPAGPERAMRHPRLRGARHTHLNPRLDQLLVELAGATFGVGALSIDVQPDRNALLRLRDQCSGEPIADETRTETELIDVHRRRRGRDVGEHRRIEVAALDVELRRCRRSPLEVQRQLAAAHLGRAREPTGVLGDRCVLNGRPAHVPSRRLRPPRGEGNECWRPPQRGRRRRRGRRLDGVPNGRRRPWSPPSPTRRR